LNWLDLSEFSVDVKKKNSAAKFKGEIRARDANSKRARKV